MSLKKSGVTGGEESVPGNLLPMNILLYNIILCCASLLLAPYYAVRIMVTGKYRRSIGPKLGLIPSRVFNAMKGAPRIWVHAVSVGEVTAAAPIIAALRALYPEACIVLSTSTETGQGMARQLVPEATSFIYYPLDIPWIVRRVLNWVKPDIFVPVETELWPNFIRICRKRSIRVVMANGRISPRSYRRYRKTRFFWKGVLRRLDALGVISAVDAERLEQLGVAVSRLTVLGNAKYDSLAARADPALRAEIAQLLAIPENSKVLVAGSTHEGEERMLLSVFGELRRTYPDLLLIIAPRHIERAGEIRSLLTSEGIKDIITVTEIRRGKGRTDEQVILVDTMGILFKVYSVATVVFCGGSLVPRGGQNVLEAAAWGKVVFYGLSMEDFLDERDALEGAGAGVAVRDEHDLSQRMLTLMAHEEGRRERGEAGRRVVEANRGTAARYATLVSSVLTEDS